MIIDELIALLGFETKGQDELRQFNQGLDDAEKKAKAAARRIDTMSVAIGGFIAGVGLEIGRRIGNLAKEFLNPWEFVAPAVQEYTKVADVATRLGVGTEALQEMRYAAEQAGIGVQNFDLGLRRFIRRSSEAAQGGGAAKGAFEELGISLKDSQGDMRSTEDLLGDVADAIMNTENQADRLRLAFRFFDSDGAAMVQMLENGSEGLQQFYQEARDLGIIMSADLVEAADRYNTALTRVDRIHRSMRSYIALNLLPAMTQVLDRFTDWYRTNSDLIRQGLDRFAAGLSRAFGFASNTAIQFGKAIWDVGRAAYFTVDRIAELMARVSGLNKAVATGVLGAAVLGSSRTGRALMLALVRRVPALGALLLVEDLMSGLRGDQSYIGSLEGGAEALEDLREKFDALREAIDGLIRAFKIDIDWSIFMAPADFINDALVTFIKELTVAIDGLAQALDAIATGNFSKLSEMLDDAVSVKFDAGLGRGEDAPLEPLFRWVDRNIFGGWLADDKARRGDRLVPQEPDPTRFGPVSDRQSRLVPSGPDPSRFGGDGPTAQGMGELRQMLENFQGNMNKLSPDAGAQAVINDHSMTDNSQDHRDQSVTVNSTVNQTIQQASQAPAAAAQATAGAVTSAVPPAARRITGNHQ